MLPCRQPPCLARSRTAWVRARCHLGLPGPASVVTIKSPAENLPKRPRVCLDYLLRYWARDRQQTYLRTSCPVWFADRRGSWQVVDPPVRCGRRRRRGLSVQEIVSRMTRSVFDPGKMCMDLSLVIDAPCANTSCWHSLFVCSGLRTVGIRTMMLECKAYGNLKGHDRLEMHRWHQRQISNRGEMGVVYKWLRRGSSQIQSTGWTNDKRANRYGRVV